MSVFLLILKIIGIALLAVLGLVLFLLFLVLFVPFRYGGSFDNTEEMKGEGHFSFLLKFFEVKAAYQDSALTMTLRILCFRKNLKAVGGTKEKKEDKKKEKEKVTKEKRPWKDRWVLFKDRIHQAETLLDNERVSHAFQVSGKKLKQILKSVLPKNLKGNVRFGMREPFDTARVLSAASVLLPVHRNAVEIVPNFEEKEFHAKIRTSGRIIVAALVFYALTWILNRDVLFTIRNVKKRFGKKRQEAVLKKEALRLEKEVICNG